MKHSTASASLWREFGRVFRETREAAKKSLGETARALGISTAYLCDVEKGRRGPFATERILEAAAFLGTDPVPLVIVAGTVSLDCKNVSGAHREIAVQFSRHWKGLTSEQLEAMRHILEDGPNRKTAMPLEKPAHQRIAQFLFEVGTMRKLMRMHRQTLLTDDQSDNIATHSFRTAVIGYFLAQTEGADPAKVVLMCLLHDMGESRTNDHNWIHKRYVSEDEGQVLEEQLGTLPVSGLADLAREYRERKTVEAIVAKDADVLDQVLLLREYVWQGNREAQVWLDGKTAKQPYNYLKYLVTKTAYALGVEIYNEEPSSWWRTLYQRERRKA